MSNAPDKKQTFPAVLNAYKNEIARALPKHLNADNMARIALTCFRSTPKLADCKPMSVFACVIQASQLGLRPGVLGECYLIPFKDNCTLVLGYQGLLELVRRSGMVESIGAYLVHERDDFDVHFGTDPGITHRPCFDGDPGAVKLGYAVAKLKGGGVHVEVMSKFDIDRIRDRSQNVQNAKKFNKQTPWDTDYEEMARKTMLRRICKYLPKSNELANALALDDNAYRGAQKIVLEDDGGLMLPQDVGTDEEDPQQIEDMTPRRVESTLPTVNRETGEVSVAYSEGPKNQHQPEAATQRHEDTAQQVDDTVASESMRRALLDRMQRNGWTVMDLAERWAVGPDTIPVRLVRTIQAWCSNPKPAK